MLTSIDVKFIFDSSCLSASLGNKELFSSGNILQIEDVVRRVAFLLFLLCFQPIARIFLPREASEMFRHFVFTTTTSQPCPQVFLADRSIIWQFCCTIDVISSHIAKFFQIWSTVASYDELCLGFQLIRNIEIFRINNNGHSPASPVSHIPIYMYHQLHFKDTAYLRPQSLNEYVTSENITGTASSV